MRRKTFIPKKTDIMPVKKVFLYRAGFKGSKIEMDDTMRDNVNSIYLYGLEIAEPKLFYKTFSVNEIPERIIPGVFNGIRRITIFVSTLGYKIDEEIENLIKKEQMLKASLLDAWGSESIEVLNERFDARLRAKNGKGTMRFSPGYGDVDIRVNTDILKLLNVVEVISDSKTGILKPRKSTTCLIGWYSGWGDNNERTNNRYTS